MEYLIEEIQDFKGFYQEKSYLVLFHVDKQPPHLGLVIKGEYFSLRYDKLQLGLDPETILKTIESKAIPTLFVEFQNDSDASVKDLFSKYQSIERISCLFPIREYLFANFYEDIQLVFDLLDKLKEEDRILATYCLNLKTVSGTYGIQKYSVKEVQEEIKRLQK